LFVVVVTGCAGRSLDVGSKADPPDEAGVSDGKAAGDGATGGAPQNNGSPDTSVPVDPEGQRTTPTVQATAACADSKHGPLAPYKTPAELTTLLVRRWYSCDPPRPSGMRRTPGIEFLADGRWVRLLDNGNGGFDRGSGIDNEGTWTVYDSAGKVHPPSDTTPGTYTYVYINAITGTFPSQMAFEKDPMRLKVVEATSALTTWLVPLK
jgi:hypothetical protein